MFRGCFGGAAANIARIAGRPRLGIGGTRRRSTDDRVGTDCERAHSNPRLVEWLVEELVTRVEYWKSGGGLRESIIQLLRAIEDLPSDQAALFRVVLAEGKKLFMGERLSTLDYRRFVALNETVPEIVSSEEVDRVRSEFETFARNAMTELEYEEDPEFLRTAIEDLDYVSTRLGVPLDDLEGLQQILWKWNPRKIGMSGIMIMMTADVARLRRKSLSLTNFSTLSMRRRSRGGTKHRARWG